MKLISATAKTRALLKKLQALADHGIDGERASAQLKIARLKAKFNFSGAESVEIPDLFSGQFKRSATARRIYAFGTQELDVANAVKWAIESATQIPCVFRNGDLLAEAAPGTAPKLANMAAHIALSFRALIEQFSTIQGVGINDRAAFVMGLYDGMMNETRPAGQRLPGRTRLKKMRRSKPPTAPAEPSLHLHPYSVAVSLGKQIRSSAPLEQISAELAAVTQKCLPPDAPAG